MNAVDTAIFSILNADTTLKNLCTDGAVTGQISNGAPRQGTLPAYLWFICETEVPDYTWSRRAALNLIYHFQAVALATAAKDNLEAAKDIRARLDALITDAAGLTVTGYRVGRRRPYSFYSYEEVSDGDMLGYAGLHCAVRLFPN